MTTPTAGPGRPFRAHGGHGGHGGHPWTMLICCLPMVIVALLLATGVAGTGAVLWALGCVAMMAAMMFFMPEGHHHK